MSAGCPFETGGCPAPRDLQEVAVCPANAPGSLCLPVLAYAKLRDPSGLDMMRAEDAFNPIISSFEFVREPQNWNGDVATAPDAEQTFSVTGSLRRQIVGVVVPVRQTEKEVFDKHGIVVSPADLILSLMMHGISVDAEDAQIPRTTGSSDGNWNFNRADGEITPFDRPITAREFYAALLEDEAVGIINAWLS